MSLNEVAYNDKLKVIANNGKIEIHLAKKTSDGYVRVLTVSSKERGSLQVTKLIGVSAEKFLTKYAKKQKETLVVRGVNL